MNFFKPLPVVLMGYLVGCSLPIKSLPNRERVITYAHISTTSIFRYHTDPVFQAQAMASVQGVFTWENGCLYLRQPDGRYMTAMFPRYPEDIVQWDEHHKTLTLDGHIFEMGDGIKSNGRYSEYSADNDLERYEKQGNKSCLTPTLVEIGTVSLKKHA